jgi:DNA-binding NtrC family response regulator
VNKNKPIFDRHKTATEKLPRILVVDDDSAGADSLAFMLAHAGYETQVAYSGKEAIERAKEFKPDMLLSDVRMPEIDGVQSAIEISKLFPQCQCLLFSGHVDSRAIIDDCRGKGHKFEYFEKPLHPQELISKLRFALSR